MANTKKQKALMKVAKEGNEFLNSSIDNHQRRLTESIRQLEKKIINQVKEFKTSDGTLLGPRINMKQAQKIHSQLKSMFDETYGSAARDVVKGFNGAARYIQREFKNLDISADFTSVDKDMIKTLKTSTWGTFNQFGLQTQEQLVDKMYGAVLGKTSFSDLVTSFQGILSGHKDARGRPMSMYANLYANDAIMNFHNSVHMKKATDAGMQYFLYYGNLMATSRDFCIQRVGKVYAKEVIDNWTFNWTGKSGPAFTNRGGYNCRHRWVATRIDWLDDDVPIIYDIEKDKKTAGIPAEVKPSDKLPAEVRAKMSPRQIRAIDNYVPSDKKSRTIAELQERKLADAIGGDHIIGKRPFDLFIDNEFIETKTFVSGRGQIRMRPASKKKKLDFIKRYKVRGHTVAVDMRQGSDTYGKVFYRKGLGDFRINNMKQVKDYDELKQLLKKGSKKMPELTTAYRTGVPTAKSVKQAENYAIKNFKVANVDYDEISNKSATLLNRYIGGCIDELKVKPSSIMFDDSFFAKGATKRYAAIATEDGNLYLNRKYFKSINEVKRLAEEQFSNGQFLTASDGHILRHEMGHLKYFKLGGTEMSASKKLTKVMINDLKQIGPENLSQYVSSYAKMNQGEFYAEMMAKKLNGERIHPICQKIMNDIESGLKRLRKLKKVGGKGVAAEIKEAKLTSSIRGNKFNIKVGGEKRTWKIPFSFDATPGEIESTFDEFASLARSKGISEKKIEKVKKKFIEKGYKLESVSEKVVSKSKPIKKPKKVKSLAKVEESKSISIGRQRGHIPVPEYEELSKGEKIKIILDDFNTFGKPINEAGAKKILKSLDGYVGDYYSEIRHYQMGRINEIPEGLRKAAKRFASSLEKYLKAAPEYNRKEVLWRGMSKKRSVFESLKIGDVYDPGAISSWSSNKDAALKFASNIQNDVILKLEGGSPNSAAISHFSTEEFIEEAEVLLSKKNKFKVVSKGFTKNRYGDEVLEITVKFVR